MTTKLSEKTRIPLPEDIQPGDVLVLRDGKRRWFDAWTSNGDCMCVGMRPGGFNADGSWWGISERHPEWDVVAIERKAKPEKARPDKDAAYLAWMAESHPILWGPAQIRRIRAIAKRLNGGVAP